MLVVRDPVGNTHGEWAVTTKMCYSVQRVTRRVYQIRQRVYNVLKNSRTYRVVALSWAPFAGASGR